MLALHIYFRQLGLRWPLRDNDDVEIWAAQLVTTMTGRMLRNLVELHLAGAAMQTQIAAMMPTPQKPGAMLSRRGATQDDRRALKVARRRRRKA